MPLFVLLLVLLLASAHVKADDSLESMLQMSLEDLMEYEVVTPTRTSLRLADSPGSVRLITNDEIRRSAAQTIPELLRVVAGVNVRWNPMVQTLDVRGFGSTPFSSQVLLMIDGVPYNSWNKAGFPQHPGFDFFNLANVKHIELVRGPGSALYGENAFNGVVNIVTLSGDDDVSLRLATKAGSQDTRTVSVSKGFVFAPQTNLFASVRRFQGQLPTELWAEESDSQATGYDAFLKLKHGDLEATYYRLSDEFDGFTHTPEGSPLPPGSVFRSASKIEQTVDIFGLQYRKEAVSGKWSFTANASHAQRDGSHCAACHAPAQDSEFTKVEDHGFQTYLHTQLGISAIEGHDLLVGAEARRIASGDHQHELHGAEHVGVPHDTSVLEYDKLSLFVQDRMTLLDGRLQLVAGVRYDGSTSPKLFDSEVHPRFAAVYDLSDAVTLRASWGRASRYPSFSELYQATWFLAAESPAVTIPLAQFEPNEELGPEQIESFELSMSARPTEHWQIQLDAYRNEITDHIAIAYPRIRYENHPQDARVTGMEAEVRYMPSTRFTAFVNYAYQHNERLGTGTDSMGSELDFSYSPRHKVNAGFTYSPAESLSMSVQASWKDEYQAPDFWYGIVFGPAAQPRPLDGYTLLNATVTYRLPFGKDGRRPLAVRLVGRNLGNERPYETLTGFGGRNVGRQGYLVFEYQLQD